MDSVYGNPASIFWNSQTSGKYVIKDALVDIMFLDFEKACVMYLTRLLSKQFLGDKRMGYGLETW